MTTLGFIVRWLHLTSSLLLAGAFLMLLLAGRSDRPTALAWQESVVRWARWLVGLVLVSGVGVLAWQAAQVTGRSTAALEPAAWIEVLARTRFGTLWLARHGLLVLLAALVLLREREDSTADWAAFRIEGLVLVGAAIGLVAWAGHAASVESWGLASVLVHGVHLLAAAAWLGALPALALLIRAGSRAAGADARPYAVIATRRFSALALPAMVILVVTGAWNTWMQAEDIAALVGTRYGALVLLKVLLVIPIVVLAAWNRERLLPALSGDGASIGRPAMVRLSWTLAGEIGFGLLILAVVSLLSVTPPGRHESPWWPFSFRLDYESTIGLPGAKTRLLIGSQIVTLSLLGGLVACVVRRVRLGLIATSVGGVLLGLWVALPPLAVDAYPTTYRRTSVPYTALSISKGLALYHDHCASCHGADGGGDGPAAGGLPRRPADLTAPHTSQHTAGDIFWWVTHGIPRSGMPGFEQALPEEDRWDLINFLRALAAGDRARPLGEVVEPDRPWLVAPDFAFSVGPVTRALKDYRGRPVLLVFFTLPDSRARMSELAQAYDSLRGLGADLIAVPMDGGEQIVSRLGGTPPILFPVATEGSRDAAAAYGLFRRTLAPEGLLPDPPMPRHMEFLIDRQGYIRARLVVGDTGPPTWPEPAQLVAEIQRLNQEQPSAPPADEHVH